MPELHPIKDATFYKSLLDSIPFTVAVVDADGEILHTNWQWDQFGLENEVDPAYLGHGENYFEICRKSDDIHAKEAYQGIKSVVEGENEQYSYEYPCHSEEKKRWFIMRVRKFSVDGSAYYLIAHSDITERVQAERKLRHTEKLASLGEMAAGVMHEINNPNASIKLNTEYLQKAWSKIEEFLEDGSLTSDDLSVLNEFTDSIEAIESAARRIENIVNKVKVFAGESGDLTRERFAPNQAVREVLQPLRERQDAGFMEVKFEETNDDELPLELSRSEFQQIVSNLVKNALDAVSKVSDPEVIVRTESSDGVFRIIVEDNGPGIPEEVQRKIFDPFFTTKDPGEGTGLGLSIVRGIVDRIEGEIEIESHDGQGTKFIIQIPYTQDDQPTPETVSDR